MSTTPMSVQDALWLTMDRPNNLMVIDSVMWFASPLDWPAVEQVIFDRLVEPFAVFRSRPKRQGSTWMWEELDDFELADHINYVELAEGAGFEQLRQFIGAQRSVAFDRTRPLWTIYCITNLTMDDGSVGSALLARFHHSIADGIRLTQAVMGLCDLDPADVTAVGRSLPHPRSGMGPVVSTSRNVISDVVDLGKTTAATVGNAVSSVGSALFRGDVRSAGGAVVDDTKGIFAFGLSALKFPERLMDVSLLVSSPHNRAANDTAAVGKLLLAGESVNTVWSGEASVGKDAGWAPTFDLATVKEIGHSTGTTVNDVLLTAVAGALGRYLREKGDDTVEELLWMVPVSVAPVEAGVPKELGNHFALVVLRMPVGLGSLAARLAEMHARMDRIKRSDEALLTFGLQRGIATAPNVLSVAVTNYFANKAVGILTNVPGPRSPMRLAGTEVEGMLGWAPCSGNQPMTICMFSYNGKVSIGFGADKALVPDIGRLGELVSEEFADMVAQTIGS
jgi:diacylglycerol O-acyltransferase